MTYCQDCGAGNEEGRSDCRICGRLLDRERGAEPCRGCGAPLGVDAAAVRGAHNAAAFEVAPTDPAIEHGPVAIGLDLDLPDWIKRAAAHTPVSEQFEPPSADTLLPPGFVVASVASAASPTGDGEDREIPAVAQPAGDHLLAERSVVSAADVSEDVLLEPPTASEHARPLPPLPDGGLAESMPDWLRARPAEPPIVAVAEIATFARPEPPAADRLDRGAGDRLAPAPDGAAAGVEAFTSDPTSFIGENDLPQWIRQLVANGEAEADRARRIALAGDEEAPARQPQDTAARPALRGGVMIDQPGSAPTWLARSERPAARLGTFASVPADPETDDGGRGAVAAEVEDSSQGRGTGALSRPLTAPEAALPAAPAPQQPILVPSVRPEAPVALPAERVRRLLPIALAVGLILLALLAYLFGSGVLP